jgi:hypothetical protein
MSIAAWAAYRNGKTTWLDDDAGHIAAIVPVDVARKVPRVLSLNRAGLLSDLMRAVQLSNKQSGVKLRYYYAGSDTDKPAEYVLRAFTRQDGSLLSENEDVRDTYVWCSGFLEHWFKVEELLDALDNTTSGRFGMENPMAVIDYPEEKK